jgi:hypothetical protein
MGVRRSADACNSSPQIAAQGTSAHGSLSEHPIISRRGVVRLNALVSVLAYQLSGESACGAQELQP